MWLKPALVVLLACGVALSACASRNITAATGTLPATVTKAANTPTRPSPTASITHASTATGTPTQLSRVSLCSLDSMPQTDDWPSYSLDKIGISFRYPPGSSATEHHYEGDRYDITIDGPDFLGLIMANLESPFNVSLLSVTCTGTAHIAAAARDYFIGDYPGASTGRVALYLPMSINTKEFFVIITFPPADQERKAWAFALLDSLSFEQ